jgi:hypothetical protein
MTPEDRVWLNAYALVARDMPVLLRGYGWARAKGAVKGSLKSHRQKITREVYTSPREAGRIDALLDSVGC